MTRRGACRGIVRSGFPILEYRSGPWAAAQAGRSVGSCDRQDAQAPRVGAGQAPSCRTCFLSAAVRNGSSPTEAASISPSPCANFARHSSAGTSVRAHHEPTEATRRFRFTDVSALRRQVLRIAVTWHAPCTLLLVRGPLSRMLCGAVTRESSSMGAAAEHCEEIREKRGYAREPPRPPTIRVADSLRKESGHEKSYRDGVDLRNGCGGGGW